MTVQKSQPNNVEAMTGTPTSPSENGEKLHTPTPWRVKPGTAIIEQFKDGLWGLIVADCRMTDEGEANAAFIVEAVAALTRPAPSSPALDPVTVEACAHELEQRYPGHTWVNAYCAAIRALIGQPAPKSEPRFFIDHGMIHDRVTGKHVTTEPDSAFCDGIVKCCQLLNELAGTPEPRTFPLLFTSDWLKDKIATDPDIECEAGPDLAKPAPSSTVGELDQGNASVASPSNGHPGSVEAQGLAKLREWKDAILSKCKHSDGFATLEWSGDKEGWGFVHYFIGHLETRALHAETVLAEQDASPPPPDTAVREALKEAIDVFEGMNDDEINMELLPRLRAALPPDAGSRK